MASSERYTEFDDRPGSTHNLVVELVEPQSKVLEFGCASGYMSWVLKNRLNCMVTGIEISERAAELAREICDRVIVGDAERIDFASELTNEQYDVILFADVLEHLREPSTLLRRIARHLAPTGAVIASIPNVAHGSVRLALLQGRFRYTRVGLLDDSHLRFFTAETIHDLFEESGFVVTDWNRRRVEIDQSELVLDRGLVSDEILEQLKHDPEATTYQFVVRAVASGSAAELSNLRKLEHALEERLRDTEKNNLLLSRQLNDAIAWAQKSADDVSIRDDIIHGLQKSLNEQTSWALTLLKDIERRDILINELKESVAREASIRIQQIAELRGQLERLRKRIPISVVLAQGIKSVINARAR